MSHRTIYTKYSDRALKNRKQLGEYKIGERVKGPSVSKNGKYYFIVRYFNKNYVGLSDTKHGVVKKTARLDKIKVLN